MRKTHSDSYNYNCTYTYISCIVTHKSVHLWLMEQIDLLYNSFVQICIEANVQSHIATCQHYLNFNIKLSVSVPSIHCCKCIPHTCMHTADSNSIMTSVPVYLPELLTRMHACMRYPDEYACSSQIKINIQSCITIILTLKFRYQIISIGTIYTLL